ncbi:tyrosine-type recombinase/integrase [Micromonospora sp. C51]|uniref:tyrosine-type recombinase/integrase n=1 Tax=Micromonospora sp. C51 TaxID=2824879 RepID=UPI001B36A394|nr:tyrosine-type recombinase/integrase [Micromonospora sp. C51]MBQ1047779.1 tyrosine-type recombinase/integrase [Micromonospora sp. C51]
MTIDCGSQPPRASMDARFRKAGETLATKGQRGTSWRVYWRRKGRDGRSVRDQAGKVITESTTWPSEELADRALEIAEGHRHEWTAEQVYAEILGPSEEETPSGAPTFAQFFDEWLPTKTRISPGTRAQYQQQFRDHLAPTFGSLPLDRIDYKLIGQWINARREKVKPTTVTREYSVLYQVLEKAVVEGHINRNPCRQTDFKRDRREDDDVPDLREKYLTADEYDFVKSLFAEEWHPLLEFFAGTGARWSEATAATIGHIVHPTDRDPVPKIRIWQAWKRTGEGAAQYLGVPKGREKRTVPIEMPLYELLLKITKGRRKKELIFPGPGGPLQPLHYSNFWNKVWVPALIEAQRCHEHPPPPRERRLEGAKGRCRDYGGMTKKGGPCGARVQTGITRCTGHMGPDPDAVSTCDCPGVLRLDGEVYGPHLLRHSFATWLYNQGVPRITIANLLGHADTRTTERYGHDMRDEASVVLALATARSRVPASPRKAA